MGPLPSTTRVFRLASGAEPHGVVNSQVEWEMFDPDTYRDHNYRSLRDDDQQIIQRLRDFFAAAGVRGARGVDVGAGANLYPALAMLPFCDIIDLADFAHRNAEWLRREVRSFDRAWDPFWAEFAANPAYARIEDPRQRLATTAAVYRASLFALPARRWDIGTMFFVACSISTDLNEFGRAVAAFAGALKPHAPFAAAFMIDSEGYFVGDHWFPAARIGVAEIEEGFAGLATGVEYHEIPTSAPLREGYGGTCLVTGRALP